MFSVEHASSTGPAVMEAAPPPPPPPPPPNTE